MFVDEYRGHDVRHRLLDDRFEVGRSCWRDPFGRGDLILEIEIPVMSLNKRWNEPGLGLEVAG